MATGITEDDVWKAADALLLEGQRPTIERVRQKIGRGSPNTVQPHLDSWFRGLGARIRDPQAFVAPCSAPDPVMQVAEHLWQVALSEARSNVEKDYAERFAELKSEQIQLEGAKQELTVKELEVQARVEAALAERDLMARQLEEMRQREAAQQLALSGANAHVEQLSEMLRNARQQLDEIRVSFDHERREMQDQARQQENHWLMEIDRLRQSLREAKSEAETAAQHERETVAVVSQRAFEAESRLALSQGACKQFQEQASELADRLKQQSQMLESKQVQFNESCIRADLLQQTLEDERRARLTLLVSKRKSHPARQSKWLGRRSQNGARG